MERCISCGDELSKMERNRAECWECRERTYEAYDEEEVSDDTHLKIKDVSEKKG
jgi:hypothetical protein